MTAETIRRYEATAVSPETLAALIAQGAWTWVYAERPADTILTWFEAVAGGDVAWQAWRHGRVFSETAELAWWRLAAGGFDCRWLAATEAPAGASWQETGIAARLGQAEETLLHGARDEGTVDPPTWSEARIPRYLAYPVAPEEASAAARVALRIQRYRGQNGDIVSRLISVVPVSTQEDVVP